jgi:hypothetical protein
MTPQREGGCLCGAVRYTATGEPMRTLVCHCRFCQRMTGSTSYAESMYPIDAVQFRGPPMAQYAHRSEGSGKSVFLHFCPRCATTVTLTFERWPQYRAVSRGTLDDPNSVTIGSHIWTDSAQTGVVLPAATDCFRAARASLDGTPLPATRYDEPSVTRPFT